MTATTELVERDGSVVRVLGRGALVGLVLNSVVGTGIFVLPGTIAGLLGWPGVWVWIIAALFIGLIVAAFAEVSSRFTGAGGAYRYTDAAFGSYVGIQVAWLTYFSRVLSAAAQAGLLTTALAEFWPFAGTRVGGIVISGLFIWTLAIVNVRGTSAGASASNAFAVLKMTALFAFAFAGIAWWSTGRAVVPASVPHPVFSDWTRALLLLVFGYGGFEGALIPLGEARDPRRDAPWALGVGLSLVVVLYVSVQWAVLATVADPGGAARPVAAAARTMFGTPGAIFATALVASSVYGWMASSMLNMPRLTATLAYDGALPSVLGRLHPRYGTPWISVLVFAGLGWGLAIFGGLLQNVSLAAVARLIPYAGVSAALIVFRRRESRGAAMGEAQSAALRVPGGPVIAVLGTVTALWIATRMSANEAKAMAIVVALASVHYVLSRQRQRGATA